ncbi:MFS transporter [Rhizobium sp. FKY42]|uniref:MFS transporter n=1 Tax=Rhizobium sp. FKY42 TaxID=2562310 RepID=UPI0010C05332|nr:MFS transporter [Rhizobium sp. FKY42]
MNTKAKPQHASNLKVASLFAGLYAAQAITGSLVQTGLPTVLRESGTALDKLGMLSLIFLPWACKFLWAPVVDRYGVVRLGHRRTWLLACQTLIAISFMAMAWFPPQEHFTALLVLLLAIAFFAATQDIATDALAVEAVDERCRGLVSGSSVFGGYFGFLLGVGAWLPVYATFGWSASMIFMAALVLVMTLPAIIARPVEAIIQKDQSSYRPGLKAAFASASLRRGLLFLLVYQAGLRLGMSLIGPYLIDAGLDLSQIGWLKGVGGAVAGLGAALLGSVFLRHLGRHALVGAALLNASVFAALGLCAIFGSVPSQLIGSLVLLQAAAAAFSMMALYATMIGWCSPNQAGTDFALLQSVDAILAIGFSIAAGFISQNAGHHANFAIAAALLVIAAMSSTRLLRGILPTKPRRLILSN